MPPPERAPDLPPAAKRARHHASPDRDSPPPTATPALLSPVDEDGALGLGGEPAGKAGQSSSFRNVSACNRCRLRKNRCDQRLPSCASCEKAGVACVGYDPITKREIPRSYIFYLEKRVQQLEALLTANSLPFPPAQDLDYCAKASDAARTSYSEGADAASSGERETSGGGGGESRSQGVGARGSFSSTANNRHLGSTSGISFAGVVFAALQSSVSDHKSNSDNGGVRPYRPPQRAGQAATSGTSMRDSFFGLHNTPIMSPIAFPAKNLGLRLAGLYFEHANPQLPVMHRMEFMDMFERAYAEEGRVRGPRELYVLNMVFAIGAGIIVGDSKGGTLSLGAARPASSGSRPEEFHASAIVHLEACLSSGDRLRGLQAVLLLANFALLRPVPPGLWYIIGVAMRLALDLGLHYEDGKEVDSGPEDASAPQQGTTARERGGREYVRDFKRRLWWSTYSLDRLISTCINRPFGVSDQVITTEFPSLLDDRFITPSGMIPQTPETLRPTYKLVAHHYFRLRLLQSEILQVLQFRQAQSARAGQDQNPYMHTDLPSPFLLRFDSFRSWRIDVDKRLWEWKNSAPKKQDTGVAFSTDFLDLNYWQAIIMLYRQSLSVPIVFEDEYDTSKEVGSPAVYNAELREDEDRVYLKIAEAGQKVLRLYRQLHLARLVNHTYLTTHHLFVAGIAYLYAIWHSPIVRSRLSMEEFDFTVLAATSVFMDFIDKCPPAEACKDAFERTVKATLKMVNAAGGFGPQGTSSGAYNSMQSLDNSRLDWRSRGEGVSLPNNPLQSQYTMDPLTTTTGVYATNPSVVSAYKKGPQYRLPGGVSAAALKPELDTLPAMRGMPGPLPPQRIASPVDINNPDPLGTIEQPIGPRASRGTTSLTPSPIAETGPALPFGPSTPVAVGPAGNLLSISPSQQQQQQQQRPNPAGLSFGDLQGLEFLQSLPSIDNNSSNNNNAASIDANGSSGGGVGGAAGMEDGLGMDGGVDFSGLADTQMDLGFGLGWEGLHHDFGGDGQPLDLFDGFFFGGGSGGTFGGRGG